MPRLEFPIMESKLLKSSKLPKGKEAIIREMKGDMYFISRLREMGFSESVRISKFSEDAHRTIILNLRGKKMFLTENAAECILVEII